MSVPKRTTRPGDDQVGVDYTRAPGIAAHIAKHARLANAKHKADKVAALLETREWKGSLVVEGFDSKGRAGVLLRHATGARAFVFTETL